MGEYLFPINVKFVGAGNSLIPGTGDNVLFANILLVAFVMVLCFLLVKLFRKRPSYDSFGSLVMGSKKLSISIAAVILALLCTIFVPLSISYADETKDEITLEVVVDEQTGEISYDDLLVKNFFKDQVRFDTTYLDISQDALDVVGLDSVYVEMKGLGGTIFSGNPGDEYQTDDAFISLKTSEEADVVFSFSNLSPDVAKQLIGKNAFVFSACAHSVWWDLDLQVESLVYNGSKQTPEITITDYYASDIKGNKYVLKEGIDYELAGELSGTNVSETGYQVYAKGLDWYQYDADFVWNIDPKKINEDTCTITVGDNPTYWGGENIVDITVHDNELDINLVRSDDYSEGDFAVTGETILTDVKASPANVKIDGFGNYVTDTLYTDDLEWNVDPRYVTFNWEAGPYTHVYNADPYQPYATISGAVSGEKIEVASYTIVKLKGDLPLVDSQAVHVGEYSATINDQIKYVGEDDATLNYAFSPAIKKPDFTVQFSITQADSLLTFPDLEDNTFEVDYNGSRDYTYTVTSDCTDITFTIADTSLAGLNNDFGDKTLTLTHKGTPGGSTINAKSVGNYDYKDININYNISCNYEDAKDRVLYSVIDDSVNAVDFKLTFYYGKRYIHYDESKGEKLFEDGIYSYYNDDSDCQFPKWFTNTTSFADATPTINPKEIDFDPSFADCELIVGSDGDNVEFKSMALWFAKIGGIEKVSGLENVAENQITDITRMFYGSGAEEVTDTSLIDLSGFAQDLLNVDNAFFHASYNKIILPDGFCDKANLHYNDMTDDDPATMFTKLPFYACYAKYLDFTGKAFSTQNKVTGCFCYCTALQDATFGDDFAIKSIADRSYLFYGCVELRHADFSNIPSNANTNSYSQDLSDSDLSSEDIDEVNENQIENADPTWISCALYGCIKIETISVSKKVQGTFTGCFGPSNDDIIAVNWFQNQDRVPYSRISGAWWTDDDVHDFRRAVSIRVRSNASSVGIISETLEDPHPLDPSVLYALYKADQPVTVVNAKISDQAQQSTFKYYTPGEEGADDVLVTKVLYAITITEKVEQYNVVFQKWSFDPWYEGDFYDNTYHIYGDLLMEAIFSAKYCAVAEFDYDADYNIFCTLTLKDVSNDDPPEWIDNKKYYVIPLEKYVMDESPFGEVRFICKKVVIDSSMKNAPIVSMNSWFRNFNVCESITGFENLDYTNLVNTDHLFDLCNSLTELDLTAFDTRNLVNKYAETGSGAGAEFMFGQMINIEKIYVGQYWNLNEIGGDEVNINLFSLDTYKLESPLGTTLASLGQLLFDWGYDASWVLTEVFARVDNSKDIDPQSQKEEYISKVGFFYQGPPTP